MVAAISGYRAEAGSQLIIAASRTSLAIVRMEELAEPMLKVRLDIRRCKCVSTFVPKIGMIFSRALNECMLTFMLGSVKPFEKLSIIFATRPCFMI